MKSNRLNFNKFRIARLTDPQYIAGGAGTGQNHKGATDPPTNPNCILTSLVYEEDMGTGNENNDKKES